ncbi:MAG: hypothetical protein R6V62_03930 [Candidatus Fermentibacteraceae bacterium]
MELTIVIGILGVIFAAVFLFFTKGIQQFHFSRMQNELATSGRLALEQIADEVIWAGYLPYGGISSENWHPIQDATEVTLSFYADFEPFQQLDDTDYRNIFLGADNCVYITDNASLQRMVGYNITSIDFLFLDEFGNPFTFDIDPDRMDEIRHVRVSLVLQDTFMGNIYQTMVRTTISPRNLGVYRNIDPSFVPPPPMVGRVIMNVSGTGAIQSPTDDEYSMIMLMEYWGLTVIPLADDQLADYDYAANEIDIVILRDINDGTGYHSGMSASLQAIPCPVICLDADDASLVYNMALGAGQTSLYTYCEKVQHDHPVHQGVPVSAPDSTYFRAYYDAQTMNYITDTDLETIIITSVDGVSGEHGLVCVKNELLQAKRILFGLPEATKYTLNGQILFHNVLNWVTGGSQHGNPGDPISNIENFEGASGQTTEVVLWSDALNSPEVLSDSIPIFQDDFSGGSKNLSWIFTSLGPQGNISLTEETLRMQRLDFGAETRNLASTTMPLGSYSIWNDDLYLRVVTSTGLNETIGLDDGIYFRKLTGTPVILANVDFDALPFFPGEITFWNDFHGRCRIHGPAGWEGQGNFVTLDSDAANSYGQARMMLEVPTTGLGENSSFTVNFRFHSHNDSNHSYDPFNGSGDFLGWNSTGQIDGEVNLVANLTPASYVNNQWFNRAVSFSIPGVPPDPLYLVFSQYDNGSAVDLYGERGISFDNLEVVAGIQDTTYSRIGIPLPSPGWGSIIIDLDDAAINFGVPFDDEFEITLSQSGTGQWNTHGISWDNFEVGVVDTVFTLPGWSKGSIGAGVDDWSVRQNPSNPFDFMWALFANSDNYYSNNASCYIETPSFLVPGEAIDPVLFFRHAFQMEAANDFGFVQVSISGGPWTDVGPESGLAYNYEVGGRSVFSGMRSWNKQSIDLEPYKGFSVKFRFVFQSNDSIVGQGWFLDDFSAECVINGYEVKSISFLADWVPLYAFGDVDIYVGSTDLTSFSSGGELSKATMFLAYSGPFTTIAGSNWQTVHFPQSFYLPAGMNLAVKVETQQSPLGPVGQFVHASRTNMSRYAQNNTEDPSYLSLADTRPATGIEISGETVYIDSDGTQSSSSMPFNFLYTFGDFEAIYTQDDLGLGSGVSWIFGGTNTDWEIGAPVFIPDVDPALLAANEWTIAGNDLTNDGYYNDNSWAWMSSTGYPMEEAAPYDTVRVRFFRCLRLASNDLAYVQVGFSTEVDDLPKESEWITVRTYHGSYNDNWQYDTIDISQHVAEHPTDSYYFIRFVLDSGVFGTRGGWNLDNIQIFGRSAGGM